VGHGPTPVKQGSLKIRRFLSTQTRRNSAIVFFSFPLLYSMLAHV
jgi:hypothetical protein